MCLVAVACQKEATQDKLSGIIKANVGADDQQTKSADLSSSELSQTMVMDSDSLLLQEFVSDNLSQPFGDGAPETKGTIVTTSNIASVYGEFGIEAFLKNYGGETPEQYINGGQVKYTGSMWNINDGSGNKYRWIDNEYTFWSFAPKSHPGTYSYGSAGSRGSVTISGFVNQTNAADQKDILFAYNSRPYGSGNRSETIDIKFRHALAAISFDVSGIRYCTLEKVTITDAYSKGTCVINGANLSSSDVTKAFAWTVDNTSAATFEMASGSGTFNMIPQTLPGTAKIKISLKVGSESKTIEKPFTTKWLPGKAYKYVLTYDPSTYAFTINETSITISNTEAASEQFSFAVTSTRTNPEGTSNWGWKIKSYQVGSEDAVTVNASSFSNGGGIDAAVSGGNLTVQARKRVPDSKGSNSYWTGNNGDWSPADWSSKGVIDISKYNYETETTGNSMNTANCYIVRHAGTYKIPLVYGNAVKNGSVNGDAYSGMPEVVTSGTFNDTKNHNDCYYYKTEAFIENSPNYHQYWKGLIIKERHDDIASYLSASSAALFWQDSDNVVTGVKIVGDGQDPGNYIASNVRYLQFTVAQSTICQCNAVIGVKDSSGNVLWSWHIWVTNDPVLKGDNAISVTNLANKTFRFLPANTLGWKYPLTYPEVGPIKIVLAQDNSGKELEFDVTLAPSQGEYKSVWFQWGRKDPIPSKGEVAGFSISNNLANIIAVIRHPNIHYYVKDKGWCTTNYTNLWKSTKTIYDPSPVGYKVPDYDAYTGFTKNGGKQTNAMGNYNCKSFSPEGCHFYTSPNGTSSTPTIYFPAAGYLSGQTGSLSNQHMHGNYWSTGLYPEPNDNDKIGLRRYYLSFSYDDSNPGSISHHVSPLNFSYTALGASVRPVKE